MKAVIVTVLLAMLLTYFTGTCLVYKALRECIECRYGEERVRIVWWRLLWRSLIWPVPSRVLRWRDFVWDQKRRELECRLGQKQSSSL